MAILNLEELKKQIKDGTFTGLESLDVKFHHVVPFQKQYVETHLVKS